MQHGDDKLASAISSRICHDLICPIGAVSNRLELLEMELEMVLELLEIVLELLEIVLELEV